jgi:transcription antitermination factor NusG
MVQAVRARYLLSDGAGGASGAAAQAISEAARVCCAVCCTQITAVAGARYLFVRFDVRADDWHPIFRVAGVTGIAVAGGQPAPVSDTVVDDLRRREEDGAVPGRTPARLVFASGEKIRVTDGQFSGFVGVIDGDVLIQDICVSDLMMVCLCGMGRMIRTELPVEHVERV